MAYGVARSKREETMKLSLFIMVRSLFAAAVIAVETSSRYNSMKYTSRIILLKTVTLVRLGLDL